VINTIDDSTLDLVARIEAAASVQELAAVAARIDNLVAQWYHDGTPIARIADAVSGLNTHLFSRLWSLLAPVELVDNSCLIVMGSEGRREQILKTDQDNALLLRDGVEAAGAGEVAGRFSRALSELGYPPCPGDIMLSNPLWRQPLAAFRDTLRDWLYDADLEGLLRLAIFLDAAPVAGDAELLRDARAYLDHIFADNDALLARFAAPADQFDEDGSWWSRFTTRRDDRVLDLKKLGTFPIVHGVRALALQHRVPAVGTAQRLDALVEREALDATLARELITALHALMTLKLDHQLRQREQGRLADNLLRPAALESAQREQLKNALTTVRRFRAFLRQHFKLEAL
jgi:CBS domain-containing protein